MYNVQNEIDIIFGKILLKYQNLSKNYGKQYLNDQNVLFHID